MTIVITGQDEKMEQARKQLEDMVPVWAVLDYTKQKTIDREMLLVKVATVPHEFESEDAYHTDVDPVLAPAPMSSLLSSALQRQSINELAKLFQAKIVDVALESVVVELTAKPERIDAFVELLKPFGILEAARSGWSAHGSR
ncbi:hypothetical protein HDU91_006483 [Kappamyces sp. JEL0680]|nr:hypothetical protein HDU91_006483 [Kappamyces sp. JEL0680]